MQYRREVDGLRTLAVVPVILGHAGYTLFRGGFIGVDVFFVISGYLITSIIMGELDDGKFSIIGFYERRARRILPALFVVMAATVPFAYLWMMPDEFKNFGQSLVSTSLFSNNILLALTSDYWSMDSSFKPLLHTWSLGVEEQYYVFFPIMLIILWRCSRNYVEIVLAALFILSFGCAAWGVSRFPALSFYILPTRGWELLAGAMVAYTLKYGPKPLGVDLLHQLASLLGLAMIAGSIVVFDDSFLSPGPWMMIPVGGSVLILLFAVPTTIAYRLLSGRVMVGIGLISYSLYLWHQPLFALARVYAINPVGPGVFAALIATTFGLSYLTWRYVEAPFRDRKRISRSTIFTFSLAGSLCAISFGLYLNHTYGMYWRVFEKGDRIADLDKRIYNESVFRFKLDHFPSGNKFHIFVVGNSFARDFINMTSENFDVDNIDFVYSDTASSCVGDNPVGTRNNLLARADIIVFAGGYDDKDKIERNCVSKTVDWAKKLKKNVFFVGTKDFGYNLNWIARLPKAAKANLYNRLPDAARTTEELQERLVPEPNFISLLRPVVRSGMVPITDGNGKPLSTDRRHVTKFGAIYFGQKALKPSRYGALLERGREM